MFELTQELCSSAGFDAYEVSNHAKPGAESRHNLIYWRCGDYIGVGPGAHGRITLDGTRCATECWSQPDRWITEIYNGEPEKFRNAVSSSDQVSELLMMGLRLSEGICLSRLKSLNSEVLAESKLQELYDLELIAKDASRLRVTSKGRILLNTVVRALLPD